MGSYYKQQLNDWKRTLDVKADVVFDIGGAQDPIKGMTNSWDVKDYKIIDLAQPHVEKQRPDIEWDMNDDLFIGGYNDEYDPIYSEVEKKADLIFCLGVFDYVIEPGIAMRNINRMLKPNGIAWVEFPFAYAHHEPLMEEGCRYSEGCINRLAKQAGLEIVGIIRKMEVTGGLVRWYSEERQRMAKNYPYHGVTGFIVQFKKA